VKAQTAALEIQQLVEDKRLRETREAVHQHGKINRPATSIRLICALQNVSETTAQPLNDPLRRPRPGAP
jgi:hypothetical protein